MQIILVVFVLLHLLVVFQVELLTSVDGVFSATILCMSFDELAELVGTTTPSSIFPVHVHRAKFCRPLFLRASSPRRSEEFNGSDSLMHASRDPRDL